MMQRATTSAVRTGKRDWPLTSEHANAGKVMAHAIRAVKDLVSKNLTPKGLTTTEIFNLTQAIPNPPNFKPAILPQNATPGPFPNNLIRSQTYLKTWILPILEGNGVIQMKQVLRESTPSAAPSEKGKESTDAASASSSAPLKTERLWAWVRADPIELPPSKQDQTSKTPADIDPIWFSLDSQRKRNRFEKAVTYYLKMRDAELQEGGRQENSSKEDDFDFDKALDYYQKTQSASLKKGGYRHRMKETWMGENRNATQGKAQRRKDGRPRGNEGTEGRAEGEIAKWLRSGRKGIDRSMDQWRGVEKHRAHKRA